MPKVMSYHDHCHRITNIQRDLSIHSGKSFSSIVKRSTLVTSICEYYNFVPIFAGK